MMDPAELAKTVAAFEAGYAADRERQDWMRLNPGMGVACGYEPELDATGRPPVGLGYEHGPDPVPVYVADEPALTPTVLPASAPTDWSAGPALTGATHGGWGSVPRGGDSVVYLGTGEPARRRSLFSRLMRKGR